MLRDWLTRTVVAAALLSITAAAQQAPPKDALCEIQTTERVVAIGDVHGAFDRFVAILQETRLIDARRRWAGGRAILVQTGDVPDRGTDSRRAFDLLRQLEGEARRAGGRVHALLGNHEVLRMRGQFGLVSAGEYAAFSTRDSADLREQYYALALAGLKERARAAQQTFDEAQYRKQFLDDVPLGFVEMRQAFLPGGDYGRWLRGHSVMVKINGVAFVHGGTTPAVAASGCAGINAAARAAMRQVTPTDSATPTILTDIEGPLWFRGLVTDPPTVTAGDVDGILRSLDARAIVVGHTVDETVVNRGGDQGGDRGVRRAIGRIRALFDARVFQIDTGMVGGDFFPGGRASALEFRGATITAVYEGSREVLTPRSRHDGR